MPRWLFLAFALVLAGCGFTPVNAPAPPAGERAQAEAAGEAAQVRVAPIPERVGQLVHNALIGRLNPAGQPPEPAYVLHVRLQERVREIGLRLDETATRANLELDAVYELREADTGAVVMRGRVRSINSANILDQPFATMVSERDARERGAEDVANRIAGDVASRLSAL